MKTSGTTGGFLFCIDYAFDPRSFVQLADEACGALS